MYPDINLGTQCCACGKSIYEPEPITPDSNTHEYFSTQVAIIGPCQHTEHAACCMDRFNNREADTVVKCLKCRKVVETTLFLSMQACRALAEANSNS